MVIKMDIRSFEVRVSGPLILLDLYYGLLVGFGASPIKKTNRHDSFCAVYENNDVSFFINGNPGEPHYFEEVYNGMMAAEKEVFINDWFFSPELFLRRPCDLFPESRIDRVLTGLAQRGITVYIILYREIEEALYNNSARVKDYLSVCHPNIHVVRHPRYLIHFWSHHEKMVIIDSKIVFMGGIDLCFGRYEYPRYPLCEPVEGRTFFRGQDYSNPRIYDFENVGDHERCLIDKKTQPRMPWRDIAIRMTGPIVRGMKRHFLQFWNFNNVQFSYKNSNLKLQDGEPIAMDMNKFLKKDNAARKNTANVVERLQREAEETLGRPRNDNLRAGLIADSQPDSQPASARLRNKKRLRSLLQNNVSGEFQDQSEEEEEAFDENDEHDKAVSHMAETPGQTEVAQPGGFICQGLRSGSLWSIGLPVNMTEHSIQNAYISLIRNAEHFVYIENQFFISSTANEPVTNRVVQELADRILRAHSEGSAFVAYIVIPMLPGFGGNIVEKDGQLLRIQIEWHLRTIYRSPNSLIKQVMKVEPNWQRYIKIYGLRNHALMEEVPVSEIVYVHSKLIIVDDKCVLIGSANINDRSLRGDRDSELAVIVEEKVQVPGVLGGQQVQKSSKIREFRINCWKSLFEIEADYEDPLNPAFQEAVDSQAAINENFYFKLFGFYPHDSYKNFKDIQFRTDKPARDYYDNNKDLVKGFLLPYPVHFLEEEDSVKDKFHDLGTRLMPDICFT